MSISLLLWDVSMFEEPGFDQSVGAGPGGINVSRLGPHGAVWTRRAEVKVSP